MSIKQNRMKEIIALLTEKDRVTVKECSSSLNTSEITVRRYLNELENEGIIRRIHGGATLIKNYVINRRNRYVLEKEMELNRELKDRIGKKSASLIKPGETVAFDNGSAPIFVALHLDKDIAINALCLTFRCALELYKKTNVNIIMPGGYLDRDSNNFYSDETLSTLKKIRTDKVFISPGGVDQKLGLTCFNVSDSNLKRQIMKSSKEVILIADSTKFGKVEPSYFSDISEINTLVTDEGIPEPYRELAHELGIRLVLAESETN
jgi:DeoR/GlpR family transcriptional regulator of sugar metabolism